MLEEFRGHVFVNRIRLRESEEAAGKEVVAFGVLAIHPPGKVEQQLLEHAFKKCGVALAAWPSHLVNAPSRPCVHGRIHIAEGELISRNLAIGVHVPFAQKEIELLLGEMRIDFRKWNHVESEVPCREPGIFPFVRHRDDVAVEKMSPFTVAAEVSLL